MAVFAANVTEETSELVEKLLSSPELVKFSLQNKINLSDKTTLIRLAIINLLRHIPTNEEINQYRAALLRPHEFDDGSSIIGFGTVRHPAAHSLCGRGVCARRGWSVRRRVVRRDAARARDGAPHSPWRRTRGYPEAHHREQCYARGCWRGCGDRGRPIAHAGDGRLVVRRARNRSRDVWRYRRVVDRRSGVGERIAGAAGRQGGSDGSVEKRINSRFEILDSRCQIGRAF